MLYRLLAASALFVIAAWALSCATAQNDSREITLRAGHRTRSTNSHCPRPLPRRRRATHSKVIGWPKGKMPTPAPGLK